MVACSAYGCFNRTENQKGQDIHFFKFPNCPNQRKLWINAIRRKNWEPSIYSKLCSDHFKTDCIDKTMSKTVLRDGAVPSVFTTFQSYHSKVIVSDSMPRHSTLTGRTERRRHRDETRESRKEPMKSHVQDPMPVSCAVSACRNQHIQTKKQGKDIRYMNFPRDKEIRKIWIERCDRGDDWEPRFSRMCSIHFTDDDYERDLKAELLGTAPKKALKKTAVPSLFLSKDYSEEDKARAESKKHRDYHQTKMQLLELEPRSVDKKDDALPSCSYAIAVDSIKIEPMDQDEDSPLDIQDTIQSSLPEIPVVPNLSIVKEEPIDDIEEKLHSTSQKISAIQNSNCFSLSLKSNSTYKDCVDEMTIPMNSKEVAAPVILRGSAKSTSLSCTSTDSTDPSTISKLSCISNQLLSITPESSSTSNTCKNSTQTPSKITNISHGSKRIVLVYPDYSETSYPWVNRTKSLGKRANLSFDSNRSKNTTASYTWMNRTLPHGKRANQSHVTSRSKSTTASYTCTDGTDPTLEKLNLTPVPSKSCTEIKDKFSLFGNFVATKIRSFSDRRLQVEAQHRISNMLFEMEMKDLTHSLPVIKDISSLQTPSSAIVTQPSVISNISSSLMQLPETLPSSSDLSKISSLQTQFPAAVTLPSKPAIIENISLLTPLPATVTVPSSSAADGNSSLKALLPATVTLPSSSAISTNSSSQTQLPATLMLHSKSPMDSITSLQIQMPATETLPSSSILPVNVPFTAENAMDFNTQGILDGS